MEQLNIDGELQKIRARNADVSSATILKTETLRVVLMAIKAGARLHEHHADGRLLLQVLQGEIEFEAESEKRALQTGMIVSVDAMVLHAVAAVTDASLLLTIAWPHTQPVEKQPHRNIGYQ